MAIAPSVEIPEEYRGKHLLYTGDCFEGHQVPDRITAEMLDDSQELQAFDTLTQALEERLLALQRSGSSPLSTAIFLPDGTSYCD